MIETVEEAPGCGQPVLEFVHASNLKPIGDKTMDNQCECSFGRNTYPGYYTVKDENNCAWCGSGYPVGPASIAANLQDKENVRKSKELIDKVLKKDA